MKKKGSKSNEENFCHFIHFSDWMQVYPREAPLILYGQASLISECNETELKLPVYYIQLSHTVILGLMKTRI